MLQVDLLACLPCCLKIPCKSAGAVLAVVFFTNNLMRTGVYYIGKALISCSNLFGICKMGEGGQQLSNWDLDPRVKVDELLATVNKTETAGQLCCICSSCSYDGSSFNS